MSHQFPERSTGEGGEGAGVGGRGVGEIEAGTIIIVGFFESAINCTATRIPSKVTTITRKVLLELFHLSGVSVEAME